MRGAATTNTATTPATAGRPQRSDFCPSDYSCEGSTKVLGEIYDQLFRTADVEEQKSLLRRYEKRVLDQMAHMGVVLWWHRIVTHRSFVKGWKIAPSHYLNQQLDTVWIDDTLR